MRPPIDGGVVLITGASSGIGREIARQLASRARALILVARRVDRLEALASELRAAFPALVVEVCVCDVGDRVALARMVDQLGEKKLDVDVLVNNAGMGAMGMYDRSSWARIESLIEVNVRSVAYLTHRLVAPMVQRGRGGILNISSGFGLEFMPGFAGYIGTKHFVSAFSESLRLEVRPCGVVVTHVCPGPVATEFEANIGNFTGRQPPKFVQLSAQACARQALRAFDRGRAMVIPGLAINLVMLLGAISPRFIKRWLYSFAVPKFRALETRRV